MKSAEFKFDDSAMSQYKGNLKANSVAINQATIDNLQNRLTLLENRISENKERKRKKEELLKTNTASYDKLKASTEREDKWKTRYI